MNKASLVLFHIENFNSTTVQNTSHCQKKSKENTGFEPASHDREICTSIDSTVQEIAHSGITHRHTDKYQGKVIILQVC